MDYAVINKNNQVVSVIDWDGTWYNAKTNPRGMMSNHQIFDKDGNEYSLADCTMVDVTIRQDPDNWAEPGGTYDPDTQSFTRAAHEEPVQPTQQQIIDTISTAQVVQTLIDKGVITAQDLDAQNT